tara:strand:+ start:1609 stop:1854 length:246 start_codon:yes stop_codon:yes gene_type:complete
MKELKNINKITNKFFDYIDKGIFKHTWTLEGKGYFSNETLMLKYGSMKFYGTEKELEIYLEDLIKDESTFKLIGVHKDTEI